MKKEDYKLWKILLGTVIFLGIATGLFIGFLLPSIIDKNIAKNGIETMATVTGIEEGSAVTVNDVSTQYYRIKFTFTNADGIEIEGKTNDAYSYWDLVRIGIVKDNFQFNESVQFKIKYIGDRAVAADYQSPKSSVIIWIIVIFFGTVGIIIIGSYPIFLIKHGGTSKIKKFGKEGIGTYLDHSNSNSETYHGDGKGLINRIKSEYRSNVGPSEHCCVYFCFTNDYGELIEIKTTKDYFVKEAEALAAMKTFPIKYFGNRAIIALDRIQLLKAWNETVKNKRFN